MREFSSTQRSKRPGFHAGWQKVDQKQRDKKKKKKTSVMTSGQLTANANFSPKQSW